MLKKKENSNPRGNLYLKYSGIAFQMAGVVILFFFLGKWIDNRMGFDKPLIGISFALTGFFGYIYKLYIELFNDRK